MLVTIKQVDILSVVAETDTVIMAVPIPPGGRLATVKGHVDYNPQAVLAHDAVVACGLIGVVLPLLDPDAVTNVDTMFDQQVPKDETIVDDGLDLDFGAADATPEWEPGLPDLVELVGMSQVPEWYRRRRYMSINTHPRFIHLDTTVKYLPGESVNFDLAPRVHSSVFSMALLAFSSPVMTSTAAAGRVTPNKQEWGMLMFLSDTITNMMKELFSIVEAGAESPYEEAADFLAALTEPVVHVTAGRANDFTAVTWNVNSVLTSQVVMPDLEAPSNLSSG